MNDTYNNIGISIVGFLSIIRFFDEIEYSKSLLINPILLHNKTVTYLKSRTTKPKGIEDLITSKIELFFDFNKRYYSFLELSINTIIIAQKMNFITLQNSKIIPIKEQIDKFDFSNESLGTRAINIIQASEKLSVLLKQENTDSLYFTLRIEI
ncbi:three component ABC system middle component [Aliarcobacter butzleri]|uniref:three component ABC system middle component n=1 Tax=Aliarcobacter butzleri TaxID=28197 RepID=UPI002B242389|nr:three component ABC system middle component [Aliarcobacter butzleri]